jgi:hypothetical protein
VRVAPKAAEVEVEPAAREAARSQLEGKTVVKIVFVPGRLINFVVR